MVELNSDFEVVRYTGDGPLESEDEALAIVARVQRQFELWRMGRLLVIDRITGEKLGWCGLRWHETEQVADLGYRFFRRYWNRGYATESSIVCIDYGFQELGLDRLVAHAMEKNVASVRVLEKLGFRRKGPETLAGFSGLGFELKREEWQGRSEQGAKERRL